MNVMMMERHSQTDDESLIAHLADPQFGLAARAEHLVAPRWIDAMIAG